VKVKKSILRECLRVSREKNTEELHPEWDNFHHFSFLIWQGKILVWATNKNSGCSHIKFGYSEMSKTHSEFEVIRKRLWVDLSGSAIVNVRLNKFGETRMSCPCKTCKAFVRRNGINTVYYTVDNEEFERLTL
jgi:hypothetical protein